MFALNERPWKGLESILTQPCMSFVAKAPKATLAGLNHFRHFVSQEVPDKPIRVISHELLIGTTK